MAKYIALRWLLGIAIFSTGSLIVAVVFQNTWMAFAAAGPATISALAAIHLDP